MLQCEELEHQVTYTFKDYHGMGLLKRFKMEDAFEVIEKRASVWSSS